jgi:hypothetical protein
MWFLLNYKKIGSLLLFFVSLAALLSTWLWEILSLIGGISIWGLSFLASIVIWADAKGGAIAGRNRSRSRSVVKQD